MAFYELTRVQTTLDYRLLFWNLRLVLTAHICARPASKFPHKVGPESIHPVTCDSADEYRVSTK